MPRSLTSLPILPTHTHRCSFSFLFPSPTGVDYFVAGNRSSSFALKLLLSTIGNRGGLLKGKPEKHKISGVYMYTVVLHINSVLGVHMYTTVSALLSIGLLFQNSRGRIYHLEYLRRRASCLHPASLLQGTSESSNHMSEALPGIFSPAFAKISLNDLRLTSFIIVSYSAWPLPSLIKRKFKS